MVGDIMLRPIVLNDRDYYFIGDDFKLSVVEENVHFINGIAAVKAIGYNNQTKKKVECCGIINEDYMEVFSDKNTTYRNEKEAKRSLMFLCQNKSILRYNENDFIVTRLRVSEFFSYKTNSHVRIENDRVILINKDIGSYIKTNNDNILITCDSHNTRCRLYNISMGKYVSEIYSEILPIDNEPNVFIVRQQIDSLEDGKIDNFVIKDNLYFQIDENGNIVSKILSSRKAEYLNYDNISIDKYLETYKNELASEMKKLKGGVYSLGYPKK